MNIPRFIGGLARAGGTGLAALLVAACGGSGSGAPPPAPTEVLLLAVIGPGAVRSEPAGLDCRAASCQAIFVRNASVTLIPVPASGARFVGWSGSGLDCPRPTDCVLTMSSARSLAATFSLDSASTRNVQVEVSGAGRVVSVPAGLDCDARCSAAFPSGTELQLEARPAPGFVLAQWSVSGSTCPGTGPNCRVVLDADRSVSVQFVARDESRFPLDVAVSGGGSVVSAPPGIDCPPDCGEAFAAGTTVTLSASPAAGQRFDGWSGACSGGDACVVTMGTDRTVQAKFVAQPDGRYDLTVGVRGSGRVDSTPAGLSCAGPSADCVATFAAGTTLSLTPSAAAGFVFNGWGLDCAGRVDCSVSMEGARAVVATFSPIPAATASPCSGFYPPGFVLTGGPTLDPIPDEPKPAKGVVLAEPTYRTCRVRATDHASEPPEDFARNDYSRRQAFNADASRFLVYSIDGSWHLYATDTLRHLQRLPDLAGDAEPQWHPTDPNRLAFLPTNGVGMELLELDLRSGQSSTVADFGARLRARWPQAAVAWTRSEGSPSADGRYWCFMVETASFASLGLFTWDRQTDTIVGMRDTDGDRPDHVSMSPSGQWCVVSGDSASGTVAYSRDFASERRLLSKSEHSDLAIDAAGDDVYVSIDYGSDRGDVFMLNLRTGARTVLFPTYLDGSATAIHFSGKGFDWPGWVIVSTYADYGPPQWLHRKVFALQLAPNPRVYPLAHTMNADGGYWTEPHASVSRDMRRILFNSTWRVDSDTDVDAYLVEMPFGALR